MLPNHAPLMVAERFKVLEALFPGRIDLGLGRAPGTDPVTSYALRRRQDDRRGRFPRALPGADPVREQRLSRRAIRSARCTPCRPDVRAAADLAARLERLQRAARRHGRRRLLLRAPFLRPRPARRRCWPTASSSSLRRRARQPYAILGVRGGLRRHRRRGRAARRHHRSQLRAPRGAANICRSRAPRRRSPIPIRRPSASASRATARACSSAARRPCSTALGPLIEATKADEVMVTTMIYDHAARRHSYELLAEAFGLRAEQGATQK